MAKKPAVMPEPLELQAGNVIFKTIGDAVVIQTIASLDPSLDADEQDELAEWLDDVILARALPEAADDEG